MPLEYTEGVVQLFSELSVFFNRQDVAIAWDVCLMTMEEWFPGTWPTATAPRSTKAKRRAKRAAHSRRVATDPDDKGRVGPLSDTALNTDPTHDKFQPPTIPKTC